LEKTDLIDEVLAREEEIKDAIWLLDYKLPDVSGHLIYQETKQKSEHLACNSDMLDLIKRYKARLTIPPLEPEKIGFGDSGEQTKSADQLLSHRNRNIQIATPLEMERSATRGNQDSIPENSMELQLRDTATNISNEKTPTASDDVCKSPLGYQPSTVEKTQSFYFTENVRDSAILDEDDALPQLFVDRQVRELREIRFSVMSVRNLSRLQESVREVLRHGIGSIPVRSRLHSSATPQVSAPRPPSSHP